MLSLLVIFPIYYYLCTRPVALVFLKS
ncbi:hypothetical protein NC653_013956 [Populus alba x Populus x berolinensis]|uniref:Uncharacterized protein n=1 Tax=Populus alba x Populus x berolinensis TaxID=444605 RepID=A0AAD6QVX6_9ROSI|nr:hypothetical protein NC653_013956 [Populus alba x Populus x berolinensis]